MNVECRTRNSEGRSIVLLASFLRPSTFLVRHSTSLTLRTSVDILRRFGGAFYFRHARFFHGQRGQARLRFVIL